MEAKVSGVLLIAPLLPISTLHQAPKIIHYFALTNSMESLTIKIIRVNIQTQNNEVCNVLHHERTGKFYRVLSRNHVGKCTSHFNDYGQTD